MNDDSLPAFRIEDVRYPRTYHVSTFWKIIYWIMGAIFGISGLWCALYYPFSDSFSNTHSAGGITFFVVLGLAALGVSVYALFESFNARILWTIDSITVRYSGKGKQLLRSAIAGRRVSRQQNSPKMILLFNGLADKKPLKIRRIFATDLAFEMWVQSIPDLDKMDIDTGMAAIALDSRLGNTPEDRQNNVKTARQHSRILYFGLTALALWTWYAPAPYLLATGLLASMPWLALAMLMRTHTGYKLTISGKDLRPNLLPFISVPGIILALRAFFDVHLVSTLHVAALAIPCGIVLALIIMRCARTGVSYQLVGALALALSAYSFGVLTIANTMLDRSQPTTQTRAIFESGVRAVI